MSEIQIYSILSSDICSLFSVHCHLTSVLFYNERPGAKAPGLLF